MEMAWLISGYSQILLFVLTATSIFWVYGDTSIKPWCSVIDIILVGLNISTTHAKTHRACYLACLESPTCESANYWLKTKICEMNNASHFTVSGHQLVQQPGSIYTFTEQLGCRFQLGMTDTSSCYKNAQGDLNAENEHEQDSEWHLVFKGMAGAGNEIHTMWTTADWTSLEVNGGWRDNSAYEAWNKGELNVRRVKLSLHDVMENTTELIFSGEGSTITSWFTRNRLISSPWADLSSATTNFFSIDGDAGIYRRFYINKNYGGCEVDQGWLVVVDVKISGNCEWQRQFDEGRYPVIIYSKIGGAMHWDDTLVVNNRGVTFGMADYLTIHVDTE